jgi:glycosyltransferase involved in cell wall biosynthesis
LNKKVSILIPLYNSEVWITETIKSVLNQSYSNIELIIIDDGSTDKSYNIAHSFSSDKVIVKQQLKGGACAARNKAFEISTGDYIVFFDADDLMSIDKIKNQVEQVNLFGDEFIYSSKWIPFKNDYTNLSKNKSPLDCSFDNVMEWFKISWRQNYSAQTGIWLTPRNIIEKTGGWNETLKVNQDGEFFFRVLLNSKGIKFTENAFVYYRRDVNNSISLGNIPERASSILQSYTKYEEILNIDNSFEMRQALAYNYAKFIYIFYPKHIDLINSAFHKIEKLGVNENFNLGGNNFKLMSKYIGFKNALKMKQLLKV